MQRFNFSRFAPFQSPRHQALLGKLANSMLVRLGLAVGSVAMGLLLLVLDWRVLGGAFMILGAIFFLSGAWSAIKRDGAGGSHPPRFKLLRPRPPKI